MIIDGHAHACGPYLTPESIDLHLAEAGADLVLLTAGQAGSTKTYKVKDDTERRPEDDYMGRNNRLIRLVVALTGAAREIHAANERVRELALASPRVLQCYWASGESPEELEALRARMGFRCLKLQQVWSRRALAGPDFEDLEDWLASAGLPLFVHLADRRAALALAALVKRGLRFPVIVAHLYGFETLAEEGALGSDRLHFDLSNAYFVSRPRLRRALAAVGAARLCLGSDTPYGEDALRRTMAMVEGLGLPAAERDLVMGGNLAAILGIASAPPRPRGRA